MFVGGILSFESQLATQKQSIILLSWVCMLGEAKNKPNSIRNHTLFILTTNHCIGILRLKILGEAMHLYY